MPCHAMPFNAPASPVTHIFGVRTVVYVHYMGNTLHYIGLVVVRTVPHA